jgi:hypothetical protein
MHPGLELPIPKMTTGHSTNVAFERGSTTAKELKESYTQGLWNRRIKSYKFTCNF